MYRKANHNHLTFENFYCDEPGEDSLRGRFFCFLFGIGCWKGSDLRI